MTVGDATLAAIDTAANTSIESVLIILGTFLLCCLLSWKVG